MTILRLFLRASGVASYVYEENSGSAVGDFESDQGLISLQPALFTSSRNGIVQPDPGR